VAPHGPRIALAAGIVEFPFVRYHCDTCGRRLDSVPGEAPDDVRTFRCPQCFGRFPSPGAFVIACAAEAEGRPTGSGAAHLRLAHPVRIH